MKKYLPVFFLVAFFAAQLLFVSKAFADSPTYTDTSELCSETPDGEWCPYPDKDVTFYGKAAVRAKDFLDVTLRDPRWSHLSNNPALGSFWFETTKIIYALVVLLVLITAFVLIITRGRSITAMRFIPRFMIILLFVALSFALVQFFYQITDIIQGFFLVKNGHTISSSDLLTIAFQYDNFIGFRKAGIGYDESVFASLFLVKLTTVTYYLMAGMLLFRKIVLWFFIVASPIFPLLLLYSPIRNTAKIWTGEFFRWLFYGPIFAILLSGLVALWQANISPLNFASGATASRYPTAINILLGGPGQTVNLENSLSTPESFGLYIVALLMLWTVILLPFVLLQIFLTYFQSIELGESALLQQLLAKSTFTTPATSPIPNVTAVPSAGIARAFPFMNRFFSASSPVSVSSRQFTQTQGPKTTPETVIPKTFQYTEPTVASSGNKQSSSVATAAAGQVPLASLAGFKLPQAEEKEKAHIPNLDKDIARRANSPTLKRANLSIPTIKEVAGFDTATFTSNMQKHQEIAKTHETLESIANPGIVMQPSMRSEFSKVQDELSKEKQKGNPVATAVLSAAASVSQTKMPHIADMGILLPSANRVQSVRPQEYEEVKKMWQENYTKLEPPRDLHGKQKSRSEWIAQDIEKITKTIELLTSSDAEKNKEGMTMVGNILPFLLIGGFSRDEVIKYLEAKLTAAQNAAGKMQADEPAPPQDQPPVPTDEDNKNKAA